MKVVNARTDDAEVLTEIAFAAKQHWGYPPDWIRRWKRDLTISAEYIAQHPTFVALIEGESVGFGAVRKKAPDTLLDHLWVRPAFMRRGVGCALFQHAEQVARSLGAGRLKIVSDPHAEPFYLRMGATLCGYQPAAIGGEERFLPLFEKVL